MSVGAFLKLTLPEKNVSGLPKLRARGDGDLKRTSWGRSAGTSYLALVFVSYIGSWE
jgi:hypothetical protein